MRRYKRVDNFTIVRDGTYYFPIDSSNAEYILYREWLLAGGTLEPIDVPPVLDEDDRVSSKTIVKRLRKVIRALKLQFPAMDVDEI